MTLDELLTLSNNEREQKYRDAPKNVLVQYLNELCTELIRTRAIIKNYNVPQVSNSKPYQHHIQEKMESEPESPGEEQDDMPPELELDDDEDEII